jgi:hypothetical protein
MLAISKKSPAKGFNRLSVSPIISLGDISDFDDLHDYILHTSNPLQYLRPKNDYLPWFELDDIKGSLSSAFDYGEIMQYLEASSSKGFVEQEHVEEFNDDKANELKDVILQTKFEPGEDNAATIMFEEFVSQERTKDAVLKFIQGLFVEMYEKGNVAVCVKILTMLGGYSYDDLFPYSQVIALASLSNKSPRVTSAAINMFAHWGNREALNLLNGVEEPKEPWIKMKYLSVKKSLEEKCFVLER